MKYHLIPHTDLNNLNTAIIFLSIEPNTSSDHMTVNTKRDTKINNNNVNENKKSVIWDRNA